MTSSWRYFFQLASYVYAPDAETHFIPLFSHCSFYKNDKDSSTSVGMTLEGIPLEAYVLVPLVCSLICWRSFLALWRYSLFSRHPEPPVGRCRRIFVLFVRLLYLYSGVKWDFSFSMTSNWRYFCLLASYMYAPDAETHFIPLFSHCAFYKNVKDSSTSVGMTLERIPHVRPMC